MKGGTMAGVNENGTVKIRRSTIELILIALLGAGAGGGGMRVLLPDAKAESIECQELKKTLDRIETTGTSVSRDNTNRITALEAKLAFMVDSLKSIQSNQEAMLRMMRSPIRDRTESGN